MLPARRDTEVIDPLARVSRSQFEKLIEAFEKAWRVGPPPSIDDYLLGDTSLREALLVELAHADLEFRLRAGEAARLETYLERYPALKDDAGTVLDLLEAEYDLRRRYEADVRFDQYAQRFPVYAEDLRRRVSRALIPPGTRARRNRRSDARELPTVPGYEIIGEIGRGGMGVIYKATQSRLKRHVALKFVPSELVQDRALLDRFVREAITASALNHPNICTIHELGEDDGRPFMVLEFIEGQTLHSIARRPASVPATTRLIRQAARALAAAHAAGVVHRDIKPENIMVRDDGLVKVLDFGLARRLPTLTRRDTRGANDTSPGALLGTIAYMSPEQTRGEVLEPSSDVFSLGVVFYQLLTGFHPFENDSAFSTFHAIASSHPISPSRLNPEIPAGLAGLIESMLNKNPRLRPSAEAVQAALARKEPQQPTHADPGGASRTIVHREAELAALSAALAEVEAGRTKLVCVIGEPGIGKTTIVEDFLDAVRKRVGGHLMACGRCSERQAGTEAYQPVIDALANLNRDEIGDSIFRLLKLLAPTWHAQVVQSLATSPHVASRAPSQPAILREFCNFLEEASRLAPVVLFFDDVHWADGSTIDLLAYLGRHGQRLRVLVLVTFRPTEMLLGPHPFHSVKLDLQSKGVCSELPLVFLQKGQVHSYLSLAFPGHAFAPDFGDLVHARTEGSPLFMVELLRYLREQDVIKNREGRWSLASAVPDLQRSLPESVRAMIQRKVDQLSESDRLLLMAASVQGPEFDSAVVARLLGREATDVEERLQVLERVHNTVRLIREQSFPDRTLTLRYGFVHALYQNALYAAIQPSRKAAWSATAAQALVVHYGESIAVLAAELATLFEAARDQERAANYYLVAAENAARIFAHHEAVTLARRGLALLQSLPDTPDRARRELPLQVTLGVQLQVAQGYAAPEAERTYDRARMLCEQLQEAPPLFPVLWGLWMFYEVASNLTKSLELAERLFRLGQKAEDSAQLLQARLALAVTSFSLGDPAATREHTEQGISLYDPRRHSSHTHLYGQDPKVTFLAFRAVAQWLLGYPDQANESSREAVALGGALGHPTTYALALYFATLLRQYCRDAPAVQETAKATTAIGTEHGLSLWLANGLIMRGWALAEQGACADGIAMLRQGLADWAATGAETHRTYFLGLLAEALCRGGRFEEGLGVLAEALAQMHNTGTVFHGAELHRLHGELLLCQRSDENAYSEAEASFRQSLTIARAQQAKSLELRASMSLTRLYQKLDRQAEARHMLAECYHWFTEGFDTPDLQEAKALLAQIS